ncbi:MAG TPA: deoxyribodipyrimidine photo-lyase [Galbitalea sp.]|jgi:deoxyribodipyrimidine photo-lyase
MESRPAIVWLRDDLRVADNPALDAAARRGGPVVVVYVLDDGSDGSRPLGGASRWWLHHSLASLAGDLEAIGAALTLRSGNAPGEITSLADEIGAGAIYWNRRYTAARDRDADLKHSLRERGLDVHSFQASLMFEPWTVTTGEGKPYKVFTPFWKACLERESPRVPLAAPVHLESPGVLPASDRLEDWGLLPTKPDWAGGLAERWQPGEASGHRMLEEFATTHLADYGRRDEPAARATSYLSPHLRFGEVSPFHVWHRLHGKLDARARTNVGAFLRQLVWREFNWNILFHSPAVATTNIRPEFDDFPWAEPDPAKLDAWKSGETGIPLVDAGMRELWTSGYMHNRVRLVAASFLVKNLLVDWRIGEQWFWDTLVDADEANNPGNWQWVAGSGADAAPYFRVFNPELQAAKFDPDGEYRARWLPADELAPQPIVDLAESRRAALAAYDTMRSGTPPVE